MPLLMLSVVWDASALQPKAIDIESKGEGMFTTVSTQRLSAASVFKLWFVGLGASMVPLGVLLGVLAMLGFNTVTWNGQPLHGLAGLVSGPLLGIFMVIVFTVPLGTAAAFGLWLYSKVRPISLQMMNVVEQGDVKVHP